MLRTARLLPHKGFRHWASRRRFPSDAASLLPGLLAATPTGLTPASDDELTNTKISYTINLQSLDAHPMQDKAFPYRTPKQAPTRLLKDQPDQHVKYIFESCSGSTRTA